MDMRYTVAIILGVIAFAVFIKQNCRAQEIVYPNYAAPFSIPAEIIAIKRVENWNGTSVGAKGERGPMQFMASTWYQYSIKPHSWAASSQPAAIEEQKRVERVYLEDLIRECKASHKNPTPYMIALFHNAGGPTARAGKALARHKDFAQRVESTYQDMMK
jgi:hypothetical protein